MSRDEQKEAETECGRLREKRRESVRYETLVESHSFSLTEVLHHVLGNCDCEDIAIESLDSLNDEPWREKFVVKTLYIDNDMRFTQMADQLDCHSETAKKYVDKFNISPIDSSNRTSSPRVNKLQRIGAEDGDISIKED